MEHALGQRQGGWLSAQRDEQRQRRRQGPRRLVVGRSHEPLAAVMIDVDARTHQTTQGRNHGPLLAEPSELIVASTEERTDDLCLHQPGPGSTQSRGTVGPPIAGIEAAHAMDDRLDDVDLRTTFESIDQPTMSRSEGARLTLDVSDHRLPQPRREASGVLGVEPLTESVERAELGEQGNASGQAQSGTADRAGIVDERE